MNETYFVVREKCPACQSVNFETLYARSFLDSPIKDYLERVYAEIGNIEFEYLGGATFILEECRDCGMIFQKEIPNDFLMNKLYEEWIDPHKAFQRFRQGAKLVKRWRCAGEIMMVIAHLKKEPRKLKFLDFGMGWGKWCYMAKAFGCDSYGVELSRARIEYAHSNGIKVVEWNEIPDCKFDFINTEQVFEHIPNPLETLCHLAKALKPDGLLKISVPDGEDIRKRLRKSDWTALRNSKNHLYLISPLEHINCYNRNSIVKMAESAGLKLATIPVSTQLTYTTNLSRPMEAAKSLIRPFYRNILLKGTYLFFRLGQQS